MALLRKLRLTKIFILIISMFVVLKITKTLWKSENWRSSKYPPHMSTYSSLPNIMPTVINMTNQKPTTRSDMPTTSTSNLSRKLDVCDLLVKETSFRSSSLARRFPHIIIIGFGKAGTRALYQMIRMHPDVVGDSDEIRFFSNDVNYKRGLPFYIAQLPATKPSQKTIVKSPDYIIKPAAASRLKKALSHCNRNEDIKFIVVLRDPFKRAVSEYLEWKIQVFRRWGKSLPPFEKLCIKKSGVINNRNQQVNASIFSYHVENWLKYFAIKQICFVNGELLVKKPYSELKKMEKCLELRSYIQPKHFYFNKMKGYYCPVDSKGKPVCLSAGKGRRHPKINEEIERKLRKFYESFNKKLYSITGVDYQWS